MAGARRPAGSAAVLHGPGGIAGCGHSPGLRRGGPWPSWLDDGVFLSWLLWPGDIYGFRYDNPVEQPAGHRIT